MLPFKQSAAFGVIALCFSLTAAASDIQDAQSLFKQKQFPKALEKVNTVLSATPKDAQARFLKGLIQVEQGNTNEAISTFTILTNDHPELPEPYNNLAVLYANAGQYEKARIALEVAIRTHPSYATAHENLGDIYAKMASQAYDRALKLDKNNSDTQTKLAMIQELFSNKLGRAQPARNTATANANTPATPRTPAVVAVAPAPTAPAAVSTEKPVEPAAKPATPTAKKLSKTEAPEAVVKRWAAAWSAQDVPQYLAAYAEDFKVPGGATRSDWAALREERIKKPTAIQIKLEQVEVTPVDDSHVNVSFRQSYKSSLLSTTGKKTLVMEKTANGWLIQEERAD